MSVSNKTTILVVDDERIIAWDLRGVLNSFGYDCFGTAASGEEALALAEKRAPEMALMDIRLEGKLDGIETAKLLQQRHGTKIIFLSANADQDCRDRTQSLCVSAWLTKPITDEKLRAAVASALRSKPE